MLVKSKVSTASGTDSSEGRRVPVFSGPCNDAVVGITLLFVSIRNVAPYNIWTLIVELKYDQGAQKKK
jgi:hypothetical protein